MSQQPTGTAGKIAIGTAVVAVLVSITATVITYSRLEKLNVMPLLGGLSVALLVIFLVRGNKKS